MATFSASSKEVVVATEKNRFQIQSGKENQGAQRHYG